MAEDLERYLKERPIRARPAPLAYRFRKFVRRNRPALGARAVALVTVLTIGAYELKHRLGDAHLPPPPQSIAVLPLTNESGEASEQYFSDGISEDLIAALSQFRELKVIGASTAFATPRPMIAGRSTFTRRRSISTRVMRWPGVSSRESGQV